MRICDGFILGVITGAAIVWCWRREIEACVRDTTCASPPGPSRTSADSSAAGGKG